MTNIYGEILETICRYFDFEALSRTINVTKAAEGGYINAAVININIIYHIYDCVSDTVCDSE
jgi:septum formation topological specificity factor MinE